LNYLNFPVIIHPTKPLQGATAIDPPDFREYYNSRNPNLHPNLWPGSAAQAVQLLVSILPDIEYMNTSSLDENSFKNRFWFIYYHFFEAGSIKNRDPILSLRRKHPLR
jgi:hypothetical protein